MPGPWAALCTHHVQPTPLISTLGFLGIGFRKLSFLLQCGHLSRNQAGKDPRVTEFRHKVRDGTNKGRQSLVQRRWKPPPQPGQASRPQITTPPPSSVKMEGKSGFGVHLAVCQRRCDPGRVPRPVSSSPPRKPGRTKAQAATAGRALHLWRGVEHHGSRAA